MPSLFSPDEYVDMLLIYGECRKNARQAEHTYRERFPNRRPPSYRTFSNIELKMRTGIFPSPKNVQHIRPIRNEENSVNALASVHVNPNTSIRNVAEEIGISKTSVNRILKDNKYHPYKVHLLPDLRPNDPENRLSFIAQILVQLDNDPEFLNKIMWTDESRFHNNGVVNRHNSHYWSVENPHWVQQTHFQTIWSVNVWCGLFNGHLLGPYFYQGTLTGERYREFLRNSLPVLLQDIPLAERCTMWWQQDGAPPHNSHIVSQYLNTQFHQNWIGNSGPIKWPARSPDMTPLDFFLWGYLKQVVYAERPVNILDLQNKICQACQDISPETIRRACTTELLHRYEHCLMGKGRHFEHII